MEEFKEIQPYGNYIILNDIDLTSAETTSEFTFGSPKISFHGSIDFNGKTISKDSYSLNKRKETTSYIFYKLDEDAEIKNIVLNYYINNTKKRVTTKVNGITDTFIDEEDGIYGLFLYNKANINNIMLNLKGCSEKERINVGLIGYRNQGTIQNFIINFENKLYGTQYLAGVCLYSEGPIQNGYLYGNGFEVFGEIVNGDYRNVAGVVFQVDGSGILQNVYNITGITMIHRNSTYSYAANIVYNVGYPPVRDAVTGSIISQEDSTAEVKSVYSVQPLTTEVEVNTNNYVPYYGIINSSNKEENIGPNILNKYSKTSVNESYYFCDVAYEANEYNTKLSATLRNESKVQEGILNANGYNQFIVEEYVSNGMYPHLKLNYCMPEQENIEIEKLLGEQPIDILSGEIVKDNDISNIEISDMAKSRVEEYIKNNNIDLNGENIALATFRVFNPGGSTVTEINVKYMKTAIMAQIYDKNVTTVYTILYEPTSFLDSYEIDSVKSRTSIGKVTESVYGENEDKGIRTIDVTFVKNITTAKEWNDINNDDENGVSGLIQNYRLAVDIDFSSADYGPYITGNFQGYIDGEYKGKVHRLKNIQGTSSVFKSFTKGTIKNLYVDNFSINTSSQMVGFIERAEITDNIEISNIHISDMEVTYSGGGTPYIGGICAYLSSGSSYLANEINVQNCSVQGLNIDFTNKNDTSVCAGGIVGQLYIFGGVNAYVTNSFVQNLVINADVTSFKGIGGIVGYKGHDADERIKKGTPYVYIENCYTTGKINAMMYAGGILGYDRYGNTYIRYC